MTFIDMNDPAARKYAAACQTKAALKLALVGVKASRHHSNKDWMTAAAEITGKKFKSRDYSGAIAALCDTIDQMHDEVGK